MDRYLGRYAEFEVESKEKAAVLLGADNLVGDIYDIDLELEDGTYRAWMRNQFGDRVAFFNPSLSRELSVYMARGLVGKAVLSFVAFTESSDEGSYWGEAAIVCYPEHEEEEFSNFLKTVSERMADGVRTSVTLDAETVSKISESDGSWVPSKTVPLPNKTESKGTVVLKQRRKGTDKLIEMGRSGNKGCYVASWVFLLALVALVVWGIKSCVF